MKKTKKWTLGLVLVGLSLGISSAGGGMSIYGGIYTTSEDIQADVYAPIGTRLRLEKVLDPAAFLTSTPDPRKPKLPAADAMQLVKTLKVGDNETVKIGHLPSGVYLLRSATTAAPIIVSNLGMVIKRDTEKALVYTADRQTGEIRNAKITAFRQNQSVTSAGGLAQFKGKMTENQVFLAHSGNDWAISGSSWNSYAVPTTLGYAYTDRPIYRPGQTVEFKGVLRKPISLVPLANTAVKVRITNTDGDELYSRTLTTNAFGSLADNLTLTAAAKLGNNNITFTPAGSKEGNVLFAGSFDVQEYQKPEYAVTVKSTQANAVQGDKISVRVSAQYLFGGNLAGAKVTYNVTRAPYYAPGFDTDSLLLDPDGEGQDYGSDLVIRDTARLDANGNLEVMVPLAKTPDGQPMSYRIEAEVEDESRKTVTSQTRVIAYPAALNVQAETQNYIYEAGQPIDVSLDTRDLKNVGQAAPVTVELIRQEWVKVGQNWKNKETRMDRREVKTGADGTAQTKLNTPEGGGYVVRASVKDAQGRTSSTDSFLWITKAGEALNWYVRDMGVKLDKKTYAIGDTATILITNPKPGAPVLLTLEGDKLRSQMVLKGSGAVLTYKTKVTADMVPNIYVGAASMGNGHIYSNTRNLKVPRTDTDLKVTVTPNKERYAPGDKGTFKVNVKSAAGAGVGAELAFGVVDQAIYLIQRDSAQTMNQVYGVERDNLVGTDSSSDFYFDQVGPAATAPRKPMTSAAFAQNKSDAAAKTEAGETPPRENFKDTIVWIPNLLTDANGNATVDVTFPDNLTTWVATARAQTKEPRFGQTTASALVTKDVVARLSLPNFLVRGDITTLAGVVNNTLPQAITGTATAKLNGLTALSGAALKPAGETVNIGANGRNRSDFVVKANTAGLADVTFGIKTNSGSDALKLPLPIKTRGYAEQRSVTGSGKNPSMAFTLPAETNPQSTQISLSITPSLLSAVAPALEYLVGYPYGCTEQTMSRFLPALLVRGDLGDVALPADIKGNLNDIINVGLARLALFQHEDGGWNFWENDDSTLEMTAYVTEGLLRAKKTGVKVNNKMLDSALKYLTKNVSDAKARQAERARAYRALAEAGRADKAQILNFSRKPDLEPYAQAQMVLALLAIKEPAAAKSVLSSLKAKNISKNGLVHWEKPKHTGDYWWFDFWDDNNIQVTASVLEAIAKAEPTSDLITGTSQWLLQQRRGPQWISTQDTTSVIIASLALPKPAASANQTVEVLLDGKSVGKVEVGNKAGTLELSPQLAAGAHNLTVKGAADGAIVAAQVKYSREPANLSGTGDAFNLTRSYERLVPAWDKKDERYTYTRVPLQKNGQLQPVKVGDLVLVTMNIQPKNHSARYLMISDPIPAGMKALDERALAITGLKQDDNYEWNWNYWYAGRDLRDDRVDLYADYLAGRQAVTYVLRAQTPGTYTALPTHAFLMYNPDQETYGPAATFTVVDK